MTMENNHLPHLTSSSRSLRFLHEHLLQHQVAIESWLRKQWLLTPAPFTSSIDIRNAGYKLAPVDTNLFPAGFNNLNQDLLPMAILAAQSILNHRFPKCEKVLLIPENHTSHPFYYKSLAGLKNILTKAGYEVRIGSMIEALQKPTPVAVNGHDEIILEPLIRDGDHLKLSDFEPCVIVLNNDLSAGIPEILKNIQQPIIPSTQMGWYERMKSSHFKHYADVSNEFSKIIDVDPWLIQPYFYTCEAVDFVNREGEACLMAKTQRLLDSIKEKYKEYDIQHEPFVVIKADQGTYGLGIFMVKDASEISKLNRKQRQKLSTIKGRQKLDHVLLQEGVYTFETVGKDESVAEPVLYLLDRHVIGGFYRVHTDKRHDENLNAPGMHFEPLAFADCCINPCILEPADEKTNRYYAYGVIARLAALAAARELADIK